MEKYLHIFLKDKKEYKVFINTVYKYVDYIEYVILDNLEGHPHILAYFKDKNIESIKVKKWQGTWTNSRTNDLYSFPATSAFKKILLDFDNFFIIDMKEVAVKKYMCSLEMTSWGQADIAFFDRDGENIAYITAHEGYVIVNAKYKNDFKDFMPDEGNIYFY